jgi:CheY-like chemotaxis protein
MTASERETAPRGFRVLAVDIDPDLSGLLDVWLDPRAQITPVTTIAGMPDPGWTDAPYDLIVVDVHHPRLHGTESLKRIAREHPETPVLAVSSHFFPGVETSSAVARGLGVAAVLSKPVKRDALLHAVDRLLRSA